MFVASLVLPLVYYQKHRASRRSGQIVIGDSNAAGTAAAIPDKDTSGHMVVLPTSTYPQVDRAMRSRPVIGPISLVPPPPASGSRDGWPVYTSSQSGPNEPGIESFPERGDTLEREAQDPRQSVTLLGAAERLAPESTAPSKGDQLAVPNDDADACAATSLRFMDPDSVEMRRELVSLRAEVLRLQMRTGDSIVTVDGDSEAPPAYS